MVTASDSNGTVVDEAGFTKEKLARLIDIGGQRAHGRVADYAREFGLTYLEGQQLWSVPWWILPALRDPERTGRRCRPPVDCQWRQGRGGRRQHADHHRRNRPCSWKLACCLPWAGQRRRRGDSVWRWRRTPRVCWKAEKWMLRLHYIMLISTTLACSTAAKRSRPIMRGANIAGFVKVADAMLAQGVI